MKKQIIAVIAMVMVIMTVSPNAKGQNQHRFNHCLDDQFTVYMDTLNPVVIIHVTPNDSFPENVKNWKTIDAWCIYGKENQFHLKGDILEVVPEDGGLTYVVLIKYEQVEFVKKIGGFGRSGTARITMLEEN